MNSSNPGRRPSWRPSALTRRRRRALPAVVLLAALVPLGCGGAVEESEPAADPVEVGGLGLRFASLPAGFAVAEEESRLVLEGDGTMTVEGGEPSDFGLDPVTDANAQQTRFESLEGGQFLGVQKLITPSGPGATARGRFTQGGVVLEETTVFVVHPTVNRMITLSYVYPAGEDSGERVQALLGLVGEMEAAGAAETPAEP